MSTIVFNKFEEHLRFEESGKDVERNSLNYLEVIDGQHPDLLSRHKGLEEQGGLKHRRNSGGKVRHKRQALQDMARPLKQWLYKHRDNPYPTKTEKILLALGSHMTLVQVSNWFANARRRLKNTVRQPDLSWALRIKLYNKYVQGNAERLSISSDDSASEDGENPLQMQAGESESSRAKSVIQDGRGRGAGLRTDASLCGDYVSPPKYKNSLLNRYLNDSLRHVMSSNKGLEHRKRNHSGSFSSNEYDDDLLSPSSSETEANFTYRTGMRMETFSSNQSGTVAHKSRKPPLHPLFPPRTYAVRSERPYRRLSVPHIWADGTVPLLDLRCSGICTPVPPLWCAI
ncbi:homeobox protein Mohawk [Astyanax mexicanus]|uniref:Mohawk homeobox n=2 Tax=Astyanax mexicanus TaxID=7994 RepID=A0A3B1JZF6_ASTMX|nr:homeobox protein Mohawk [Astyanax mexicanus]